MQAEQIQRGHTYITESGKVRRVNTLDGPPQHRMVGWGAPDGSTGGRCDIQMFSSRVVREATDEETRRAEGARH